MFITNLQVKLKIKKLIAFTLAEVLIVLLTIGIVASLIIPGLINNIQDAEYKVAWKKTYADISVAIKRMMVENGGTLNEFCDGPSAITQYDCFKNELAKQLNVTKSCNYYNNCWHSNPIKYLGSNGTSTLSHGSEIILSNGAMLDIYWNPFNYIDENRVDSCQNKGPNVQGSCGTMTIDTNGYKGPNQFGKDVFNVYITLTGIKPYGTQGDLYDLNRGDSGSRYSHSGCDLTTDSKAKGLTCAADYLK